MAEGFDTSWVVDPPDVRGAGFDEWSHMTGIPSNSPLLGGPGFRGNGGGSALQGLGGLTDVVAADLGQNTYAMPGGAPADRKARAKWNDWRELFDPHSPMLWLLAFAIFATSLIHFRVQGSLGRLHAGGGVG
jgi:hypothetical protein